MFRAQDSISDGDMIAQAFKALSLGVIVGTTTYGGLAETACEYEFVDGGSCCIAGRYPYSAAEFRCLGTMWYHVVACGIGLPLRPLRRRLRSSSPPALR